MPTNSWYLKDYQKERGEKIRLVGTIMSLCVSWFLDLWCGYFVQICAELQWSISAVTGHWTACDRIWCKGDSQMGCTWLAPKQRWFTSGRHGVLRECRYGRLQPLYHLSVSELSHQLPPYPGTYVWMVVKVHLVNQAVEDSSLSLPVTMEFMKYSCGWLAEWYDFSDQMICFLWYDACLCRQTIWKVIWQQLMTQAPLICIDWSILGNIYWMSLSRSATSKLGCSPPFPILEQTERPCTGNTILPPDPVNFGRILGEGRKKV